MKYLFKTTAILLLIIFVSSCTQYILVPIPSADDSTPYDVSTAEDLTSMLETAGKAKLLQDITLTEILPQDRSYDIDLNGNTLTMDIDATYAIGSGQSLSIKDGTLDIKVPDSVKPGATQTGIEVLSGSSLTLDGVAMTANETGIMSKSDSSSIIIRNSSITANRGFAFGTNASDSAISNINIAIENSQLYSPKSGAILFNLGGSSLTIRNSHIEGSSQAVIVRGGKAEIYDSALIVTGKDDDPSGYAGYKTSQWKEGNGVPFAALVVGDNDNGAYNYGTVTCIAENVDLSTQDPLGGDLVFVSSDEGVETPADPLVQYTSVVLDIDKEYESAIRSPDGHHKGTHTSITVNDVPIVD